jgi:hypothetical protein
MKQSIRLLVSIAASGLLPGFIAYPAPQLSYGEKQTQLLAYIAPDTYEYVKLNPDSWSPPGTDSGDIPQA